MKPNFFPKQLLLFFSFVVLSLACQEDVANEELDLIDKDMVQATELADSYLASSQARRKSDKSITILKYMDGKLWFATNTDKKRGYQEVTEETVTAYVNPGEHVFWFSGGGVSDLEGIEFDAASQYQLVNSPEEINPDKMWVIMIPEDREIDADGFLKYDIIYQIQGNEGEPPIRLDPKLKVSQ
ncbi:MAG: hypothetical protein OEY56_15125 [Cyclobacteriaceae bacterium]|nr:hypothetical protein [Cyclobacteriaceae bacterium]